MVVIEEVRKLNEINSLSAGTLYAARVAAHDGNSVPWLYERETEVVVFPTECAVMCPPQGGNTRAQGGDPPETPPRSAQGRTRTPAARRVAAWPSAISRSARIRAPAGTPRRRRSPTAAARPSPARAPVRCSITRAARAGRKSCARGLRGSARRNGDRTRRSASWRSSTPTRSRRRRTAARTATGTAPMRAFFATCRSRCRTTSTTNSAPPSPKASLLNSRRATRRW